MIKVVEKTPEIFHLKFNDPNEMMLHLGRFSDYYESADKELYRSKFSLKSSIDNYIRQDRDYFGSVAGINIPSGIISRMANEFNDILTIREKFIISLIGDIRVVASSFKYLIATAGDDDDIDEIAHELAHGFYYTDEIYRLKMDAQIRLLPKRVIDEVVGWLQKENYHSSVHNDEIQAYMSTGFSEGYKIVFNRRLVNMFRSPFVDAFLEALAKNNLL